MGFYHALKASLATQVVTLIRHHGVPKFSKEYGRALAQNPESYYLMPAMFFHMSFPTVVMLFPPCLRAAIFMAQIATYYEMPPMVSEQAKSLLAKQPQLMELHCQLEVGIGCLQVLLLFTPQRSISVMMFTWQYLRIRYMTNSDVKKSVPFIQCQVGLCVRTSVLS